MSKEAIKNLLMDFMADYDPNKWSNDDVYEKYAEKIDNVRSMGEIIAFTELTKKVKELKQKLEENEIEIENLKSANKGLCKTLGMEDKDFYVVEKEEYDKMVSGAKQFANETAIKSLNKVHKFFSKTFVGVGLNTYCERVRPVESFIIEEMKKLKGGEKDV